MGDSGNSGNSGNSDDSDDSDESGDTSNVYADCILNGRLSRDCAKQEKVSKVQRHDVTSAEACQEERKMGNDNSKERITACQDMRT